ncbi:MAG: CoB--CoM heterodisulfide reductase iron-sulfur subunit A family protein [Candidatus Scalindua sp. AMX11]|nr:MAG: CoB--CoM heterodisulfide reductase iron-sulfur subunit A family protein [Candidatus Scalindua sp.]NOG84616.1 CoB--CoM heterodisulfide reductase iron-sulfur subunit A family protein [Planctomycetota bacterium]RZV92390.1 MAG: CoB--CoM heterodisulfide reductase iron-sulfur subunit A family protein [Candidatus Scalindua sp. SCAELEC01]TDE66085.1 MAG: CoB--CoM heterodisulfide reductase iron-sulfur subunit A family protein [Candidatus Scalindua sp. AMX11]GJQ59059.1 MAG: disulfide reductase [Ca
MGKKVGVFVCHCGTNISATVDVEKVAEEAKKKYPGVSYATTYKYMCSDPGQKLLRDKIKEEGLTGVVVAACSPKMHERTFRNAAVKTGLNPYQVEVSNIREQCSWVHQDKAVGTEKSIDLVRMMTEKTRKDTSLDAIKVPVTKRALVIGGGIAGIQAALDIADGGNEVILVEKDASIGGHMAQLSETFPTLDCSQCILTPRMVEVAQHENIKLYTWSQVESVGGYIGNFDVKIRKKARAVDLDLCTGCSSCWQVCPSKKIKSEFDTELGNRTAIYIPFPQAIPSKPVIDKEHCLLYRDARKKNIPPEDSKVCRKCYDVCPIAPVKAIDYAQEDEIVEVKVGAIVVATGYKELPNNVYGEYGKGKYQDVITGLQFERLASASGPTEGEIRRPSDGKEPEIIVFIQCVGSRDPAKGCSYCSKTCCMYTAKHAMLYKHKVHHGHAFVFYIDIRCAGKNYEEFSLRAIEEEGATYLRGRVSRIYKKGEKLIVLGADTLTGSQVEIEADMVVLASAMKAQDDAEVVARTLSIQYDKDRFFSELHPKLRPVESSNAGIFLAGACQGPKDIPETVAQASGAAAKVMALLSSDELEREPVVAKVDRLPPPVFSTCIGCFYCQRVCPYGAIEQEDIKARDGSVIKTVARVNEGLCQGCGLCAATCRSKSVELAGFSDEQVYAEINSVEFN